MQKAFLLIIILFSFISISATDYSPSQKKALLEIENQRDDANRKVLDGELNQAVETLNFALKTAQDHQLDSLYAAILTDMTEPLVKSGNYEKAVENCLEAADIFHDLNIDKGVTEVYYLLGNIFTYTGDFEKGSEYFQKVIAIFRENGDKQGLSSSLNNYALILNKQGKIAEAGQLIKEAIDLKLEIGDTIEVVRPYFNLVENLDHLGKYAEALEQLEKAEKIINTHSLSLEKVGYFNSKGLIYLHQGNNREAEEYFLQAIALSEEYQFLHHQSQAQQNLAKLYQETNQFENALHYYLQSHTILDSLTNSNRLKEIENLRESFEASEREKKIELLKKEESLRKLTIRFLVVSIVLILLILGGLIFYQRAIHRKKRELIELEAEKIQQELDMKNQQLTIKTLEMIRKNDFLESLSNQLKEAKKDESITPNTFQQITREIGFHQSAETDWDQFQLSFNDVHKGFTDHLKTDFPKLTITELRHCSLLKLGLSIKESASLLGITPASVKVSRNRIKKKMNLSGEESLQGVLMER